MLARSRRDAVVLLGAMAGASALALVGRPVPQSRGGSSTIDLDRMVPETFAGWQVDASTRALVRPAPVKGKTYGIYDQVLERVFIDERGHRIMLSVVYGAQQSATLQLHRPEVCYRANGYQVRDVHGDTLRVAGQSIAVTRLLAELPGRLEPVTYWTLLGDEVVADPSAFRWRWFGLAVQRRVLDGMLIRVSSINIEPRTAFELQDGFADELVRAMAPANRARLIGAVGPH